MLKLALIHLALFLDINKFQFRFQINKKEMELGWSLTGKKSVKKIEIKYVDIICIFVPKTPCLLVLKS